MSEALLSTVGWDWGTDSEGGAPGCGPCSGGPPLSYRYIDEEPLALRYRRTLTHLEERLPGENLDVALPEVLGYPAAWCPSTSLFDGYQDRAGWTRFHVAQTVAAAYLLEHPTDEGIELLGKRLRHMLAHPYEGTELGPGRGYSMPPCQYLFPGVSECLDLLCRLTAYPAALAWIEDFVAGRLDAGPIELPPVFECPPRRSYEIHEGVLLSLMPELLAVLSKVGLLEGEILRQAAAHLPALFNLPVRKVRAAALGLPPALAIGSPLSPEVEHALAGASFDLARALDEESAPAFLRAARPVGARFLLQACEHVERRGLTRLTVSEGPTALEPGSLVEALAHMADIAALEEGDQPEEVVQRLKACKPETLRAVLPVAGAGTGLVLRALGWGDAEPLVAYVRRMGRLDHARSILPGFTDLRNSDDPSEGAIDRAALLALVAKAGEERARQVLGLLESARLPIKKTLLLVQAALGVNRDKVLKALKRRSQTAVKAYGLLPLERSEEVLERYLFLRSFARESGGHGSDRRANERAAVQVALEHLAQTAGYGGARRLEQVMELQAARREPAPCERWEVGEYQLELVPSHHEPSIRVVKGRKALKSVPKAVRVSESYRQAKEVLERVRDQAARFREALEDTMVEGRPLGPEDLEGFLAVPVGRALLRALVLATEDGRFGLLTEDEAALESLDGERVAVGPCLHVARPLRLFWAGQLAGWQRLVCRRSRGQPFRQAFRELYFPDEEGGAAAVSTSRFAGHELAAPVAAKLLQSRCWRVETGDRAVPYKPFPEVRLQAVFEFPDAGHYLSETRQITSGEVYFLGYPRRDLSSRPSDLERLPFREVPGVILSEVLRDADLAVSVARLQGEVRISKETFLKRGELVLALAESLGIGGVEIDGRFVRVRGQIARYRIHLGTAEAHVEPAGHLCDLPASPRRTSLPPLIESDEPWLGEVMAKLVTLAHDGEVRDPAFRRRLRSGG
ncbi:MAG: DUF4132 domain-containing protein [Planctomycetes bacterium]|nr:DUF4132 domain-containing protein [Planctomycetota bacterium]